MFNLPTIFSVQIDGHIAQCAVLVERIVVIETFGQLSHSHLCVQTFSSFCVVPFQGFHETLPHAVNFRDSHERDHRLEAQMLGKAPSLSSRVADAVVCEPFNQLERFTIRAKAVFDCHFHQITYQGCIDAFSGGHTVYDFPVAAIQR
jgi:hypothetical protein